MNSREECGILEVELLDTRVGGGGTSDYNELENKPKINGVELVGDKTGAELGLASSGDVAGLTERVESVEADVAELKGRLSLERLGAYTYKVTFDSIPVYDGSSNPVAGGCSSFVKDGKLYRNLDWNYDNTAEFEVVTKNFKGVGFISGLNDGALDGRVNQLPYHLVDGVNNDGIMASTHILYNDWQYAGSGAKNVDLTTIVFHILNDLHSINDISTVMMPLLNNIKIPQGLANLGYVAQFFVSDGTTSFALLPPTSANGSWEITNISALPKMTNFRWLNKATIERNDAEIQSRPTGVERWNLIGNPSSTTATLEGLRFTLAYENPDRLSEFIGIDNTTKNSTDAELTAIYNRAHSEYLVRQRNGVTWQSVHSVVYGDKQILSLCTQENYGVDYAQVGGGEPEEYLKDASVANDVLTITKNDGSEVIFSGSQAEVQELTSRMNAAEDDIETLQGNVETLSDGLQDAEQDIQELQTALDVEEAARIAADANLQAQISAISVPVTSVNSKTGDVVLNATDIKLTTNQQTVQANFIRIDEEVEGIIDVIPDQATATNQLADKAFVNSTVQTSTANFRGNWANWASVPIYDYEYPADYTGTTTPSTNDYMVVQDASGYIDPLQVLTGTWRFKYTGVWTTDGRNGWHPEYQVNETPLTAAQIAALNSGITANGVAQIATNEQGIADLEGDKADKVEDAVDGNFAGLDANGNLTDSNYKPGDFLRSNIQYVSSANGRTGAVTGLEETSNKTTSLSASSTDTEYPTAKAVYDNLGLDLEWLD